MRKMLLLSSLTLASLLGFNAGYAATATVVLTNSTFDAPAGSENVEVFVQGRVIALGAQQQTSVTVNAGSTFVVKVNRITLSGYQVNRNKYPGCANGINMSLQSGQVAHMNMTANASPVNKDTIFACTFSK